VGKLDTYLGLVKRLITSLNAAGINYMFTGAIAASYYGARQRVAKLFGLTRMSMKY
jgi:hypothetical protein